MAYQPPVNVDLADLLDESSLQETALGKFFRNVMTLRAQLIEISFKT